MSQSTSNSNSGANSGIAEQIRTPAQPCAQCVKSGAECQLHAGKSVACARYCTCYFELAQLKQVYGQLQSRYCAVRWDQQRLSEMYTRMEHAVGSLTDWAMTEDAHFTAGLTPRFCCLSPTPTPSPPMTDFTINDELREQSLNPTLDNIFFDFDVPEEKWEEYLGGMEVKQEDDLGVGTSGIRSDEAQEEMEVKDGLVTLADEDLEFDGEEWGGIPEEEH
ncbi:hypothetical protein B0H10DRAFT_1974035 [Mycena sp. CBHHK59/15]|nr:hypothetical protein B0H10DRAFT_1974035 [Mycena sp. CBHHK59/15]